VATPEVVLQDLKVEVTNYLLEKAYSVPRDLLALQSYETDDGSFAIETLETPLGEIWSTRFSELTQQLQPGHGRWK
jgi:hypothetical protein